jgi:DNA-binding LytR/AlgR family response regulator
MNLRQSVPDYLTNKRNTFIQIAFTSLFAYVFINVYLPFGVEEWYRVNSFEFRLISGAVVLLGMAVIIITRLIMFQLHKNHEITVALYCWIIIAEVVLLGLFFSTLEKLILKDQRPAFDLMLNATQNTALILLIPYLLSSLFFAWSDIQKRLERVRNQFRDPSEVFVPFNDEKGKVRITLKLIDIYYLEASDNYVNIYYDDSDKLRMYMLRNSIKNLDPELVKFSIFRSHRKYSVNKVNVKFLKKGKKGYELVMKDKNETVIPVSKTFQKNVLTRFSRELITE